MLKIDELRKMTLKELEQELAKVTKDLFHAKYEVKTGSSKANHLINRLKTSKAQINTVKKELAREDEKKFKDQKVVKEEEAKPENK